MLTRYEDWPMRLAAFIDRRRAIPFAWGQSDCCLFVADAILELTGADLGAQWRDTYCDEASARRVLNEHGGVAGIATLMLGHSKIAALGGRGDVVLIDIPNGEALALHLGNAIAAQATSGIVFFPTSAAKAAWTV